MSYELKIASKYWNKSDQNSLFDYETSDYLETSLCSKISGYIMHNDKKISFSKKLSRRGHPDYLITLNKHENDFSLKMEKDLTSMNSDNKILPRFRLPSDNWFVIRHSYSKNELGFKLREGDVIKLGKVIFKVREVVISSKHVSSSKTIEMRNTNDENRFGNLHLGEEEGDEDAENRQIGIENNNNVHNDLAINNNISGIASIGGEVNRNSNMNSHLAVNEAMSNNLSVTRFTNGVGGSKPARLSHRRSSSNQKMLSSFICRICFGDNSEDVLISVCKCIGSVKYLHLKCLLRWVVSKIQLKTFNYLSVFSYESLQCELCKTAIPEIIKVQNRVVNLSSPGNLLSFMSNLEERFENYMALECIKDKRGTIDSTIEKNTIYIINMKSKNMLKLGRATDSDVRMTDISVSRFHSKLTIHNGDLYIHDNGSKFGTHVNYNYDTVLSILPNKQLGLQCDKLFLTFYLRKTCWAYLCCKKNVSELKDVEDYNTILEEIRMNSLLANNTKNEKSLKNVDVSENEKSGDVLFENEKEKTITEDQYHEECKNLTSMEMRVIDTVNNIQKKGNELKLLEDREESNISIKEIAKDEERHSSFIIDHERQHSTNYPSIPENEYGNAQNLQGITMFLNNRNNLTELRLNHKNEKIKCIDTNNDKTATGKYRSLYSNGHSSNTAHVINTDTVEIRKQQKTLITSETSKENLICQISMKHNNKTYRLPKGLTTVIDDYEDKQIRIAGSISKKTDTKIEKKESNIMKKSSSEEKKQMDICESLNDSQTIIRRENL